MQALCSQHRSELECGREPVRADRVNKTFNGTHQIHVRIPDTLNGTFPDPVGFISLIHLSGTLEVIQSWGVSLNVAQQGKKNYSSRNNITLLFTSFARLIAHNEY